MAPSGRLSRGPASGTVFSTPIVNVRGDAVGVVVTFFRKPYAPSDRQSRLVELYEKGELKLDELATRTYSLDQVNEALAALASGEGARGIIVWD